MRDIADQFNNEQYVQITDPEQYTFTAFKDNDGVESPIMPVSDRQLTDPWNIAHKVYGFVTVKHPTYGNGTLVTQAGNYSVKFYNHRTDDYYYIPGKLVPRTVPLPERKIRMPTAANAALDLRTVVGPNVNGTPVLASEMPDYKDNFFIVGVNKCKLQHGYFGSNLVIKVKCRGKDIGILMKDKLKQYFMLSYNGKPKDRGGMYDKVTYGELKEHIDERDPRRRKNETGGSSSAIDRDSDDEPEGMEFLRRRRLPASLRDESMNVDPTAMRGQKRKHSFGKAINKIDSDIKYLMSLR